MATLHIVTTVNSSLNKVRIDLYKDGTLVESKPAQVAPHPVTIWTFENLLPSEVYEWVHVELDSSNNIIRTYSKILVTVPAFGSIEVREPENIIVDLTPGLIGGATTFTFDGTGGKPDYRGWGIIPERIGAGTMYKGVTYSWNKDTGAFTLLMAGDMFNNTERFFIEFEPKAVPNYSINVKEAWSGDLVITDDITLTPNDFDKNAIIQGSDSYLKITLPDIFTVKPGKLIYFDCPPESVTKCAEIACSAAANNGNLIMWPFPNQNNIYICTSETIAIYRQRVDNTTSYWRVKFPDGNFKQLGEIIGEYTDVDDIVNKLPLTNATYNNLTYARFYNKYILNLPSSEVVAFNDWATGENKYKYSLANGSGDFHVPDLRNLYEKASGTDIASKYLPAMVGLHGHDIEFILEGNDGQPTAAGQVLKKSSTDLGNGQGQGGNGVNQYAVRPTGGDDNRPNTYVANKYVRC